MSFSQLRDKMNSSLDSISSVQDYKRAYLQSDVINTIKALNEKYIEHLMMDLIDENSDVDLRRVVKDRKDYKHSNAYALECLELAIHKSNIHGSRVKNWINSALKCFDVFLIGFINDCLEEPIKKTSKRVKETDVYQHLIDKGGRML